MMIKKIKQSLPVYFVFFFFLNCHNVTKRPDNALELSTVKFANLVYNTKKIANYAVQSRIKKHGDILKAVRKESWDWGSGVLMFGLVRSYKITMDSTILNFVSQWINYHAEKGINLSHTDHIIPATVLIELINEKRLDYDSDLYSRILNKSYHYLISESICLKGCKNTDGNYKQVQFQWRGRSWLDDLFMTGPFMVRYSELQDMPEIHYKIAKHFLAHRDLLQCHKKGSMLMKQGKRLSKDYKLCFKPVSWIPEGNVAWARGNGWYIAALADFLNHLSESNENYNELMDLYNSLIKEISDYQLEDGLFPTVLDKPSSYGEVSATALFVYATALGIQNNWLNDDKYYYLIIKGITGILDKVSSEGKVQGTSAGTTIFPCAMLYEAIPVGAYPWGTGTVLMALSQVVELADSIKQHLNEQNFDLQKFSKAKIRFLDIIDK